MIAGTGRSGNTNKRWRDCVEGKREVIARGVSKKKQDDGGQGN